MIEETFKNTVMTSIGGEFNLTYLKTDLNNKKIIVLSKNLNNKTSPLIRIQFGCFFGTTFDLVDCDCNLQVQESLKKISECNNGAFIYLPDDDGRGIGLANKMKFLTLQRKINKPPIKTAKIFHIKYEDFSTLDAIPELLSLLGIEKDITLLTNSPQKLDYLKKLGLKIEKTVNLMVSKESLTNRATDEIEEKRRILGHSFY